MTDRCYVYLLRCRDGTFYTGCTGDLERRLREHRNGTASRYTRSRRPVCLAYSEECGSRSDGARRERQLRRLPRRAKETLVAGEATGGNGILWVCSTPLGNLEDASPRLRRVLAGADVVAAEDTRIARRLLSALGLRCRVMSCHQYNEERAAARVLGILAGGGQVALVADGGTPGVSDPGPRLVRRVLEAGHPVRPVPGPSAVTAALSVAGFAAGRFVFLGFLARKGGGRRRALDSLASLDCPAVVFESPHRVMATLRDLAEVIPGRTIALCRELTKEHEEVLRGEAVSIRSRLEERFGDDVKGEITLVVGPAEKESRRSGGNPSS